MKNLFFVLFLIGCTYNDVCPYRRQLNLIDNEIKEETIKMQEIMHQPFNSDVAEQITEQEDILESLEVEKLLLQNKNCK